MKTYYYIRMKNASLLLAGEAHYHQTNRRITMDREEMALEIVEMIEDYSDETVARMYAIAQED